MKCNFYSVFVLLFYTHFLLSQDIWKPMPSPKGVEGQLVVNFDEKELFISIPYHGIFHSIDAGETWQPFTTGLYTPTSYAASMVVSKDGWLYAIIDDELYKLKRGELEWEKTIYKFNSSSGHILANPDTTLFISINSNEYIYYSKNHGDKFNSFTFGVKYIHFDASCFNGNNNNYFITRDNKSNSLVIRISDDGSIRDTIQILKLNNPVLYFDPKGYLFIYDDSQGLFRFDKDGKNKLSISGQFLVQGINRFINDKNGNLVLFGNQADYISKDAGLNWSLLDTKYGGELLSVTDYLFYSGDTCFYSYPSCTDKSSFRKTYNGGKNWGNLEVNWEAVSIDEIRFSQNNTMIASSCGGRKYYKSIDYGLHWNLIKVDANKSLIYFIGINGKNQWLTIYNDIFYISDDEGLHWNKTTFKFPNTHYFQSDFKDNIYVEALFDTIYISNNGGRSWVKSKGTFTSSHHVAFHPDGTIYRLSAFNEFSYSSDLGKHWENLDAPYGVYNLFILNSGRIYFTNLDNHFGYDYGLYYSDDKFKSVHFLGPYIFQNLVQDKNGNLFGSEPFGNIQISKDEGRTWANYHKGIPFGISPFCLAIDNDNYLYAGLQSNSIYKTILPTSPGVNTVNTEKSDFPVIQYDAQNERVLFKWRSNNNIDLPYQIINVQGRILKSGTCALGQDNVDVSALHSGLFIIKIGNKSNGYENFRFIRLE